jgi:hypothetical protein
VRFNPQGLKSLYYAKHPIARCKSAAYFRTMNHDLRTMLTVAMCIPLFGLNACQSSGDVGFSAGSAQPRAATWRCTGGVTLNIRNLGSMLAVRDSRGFETELPPDPPGQRERYSKTGYALVFAGRTASWFASGQQPSDCKR